MGWLNSWKKRVKLIVDNTNIDGDLSNFPILIKISNSSGIGSTNVTSIFTELGSDTNRKKVAITTSDGTTQCYVEIERFDYSNSVAWLWVKAPSVASGATTDFYLYYDNSKSDNTSYIGDTGDTPAQSVWDSNFKLVMHMAQDPNGDVADAIKDSTSNVNHGTPAGAMTSADLVDGKIGKGTDLDGTDDNIDCGDCAGLEAGTNDLTIEICVNRYGNIGQQRLIIKREADLTWYDLHFDSDNYVKASLAVSYPPHGVFASTTQITDSNWHDLVAVFDRDSNGQIYIDGFPNGSPVDISAISGDITTSAKFFIGAYGKNLDPAYTHYFKGKTDEVRISNTARSDDWIKATYYSNWDELVSFGSEQFEFCVSGYVKEGTIPVNRQIYLHNRDTGALITSTTSSGAGGYFYLETTYSGAHYVVCLDDEAGVDYNDLIYGNIYPVTTFG